jgi:hypothetical protein
MPEQYGSTEQLSPLGQILFREIEGLRNDLHGVAQEFRSASKEFTQELRTVAVEIAQIRTQNVAQELENLKKEDITTIKTRLGNVEIQQVRMATVWTVLYVLMGIVFAALQIYTAVKK